MAETTEETPAKSGRQKTTRLALHEKHFPTDAFDPSIKGVDPITVDGTDVDAEHVDKVQQAASDAGLTLKTVKGN